MYFIYYNSHFYSLPILKKKSIIRFICNHLIEYPTPCDLNYAWSFGSLLSLILVMQVLTGIVLTMYYTTSSDLAFNSVERIMRDISSGWLFRYMHSNGASFIFLSLIIINCIYYFYYLRLLKNILYNKDYNNVFIKVTSDQATLLDAEQNIMYTIVYMFIFLI